MKKKDKKFPLVPLQAAPMMIKGRSCDVSLKI